MGKPRHSQLQRGMAGECDRMRKGSCIYQEQHSRLRIALLQRYSDDEGQHNSYFSANLQYFRKVTSQYMGILRRLYRRYAETAPCR